MKKLNVGLIGCGGVATNFHLKAWGKNPGIDLVACCDSRREAAQKAAASFDIPRVYTEYRRMLRSEKLDAVVICTPPFCHMEQSVAALSAGVHVLCEKPMALNAAQAERMCAAARKARRILAIAFNNRYYRMNQKLKELISAGGIGKVYYARVQALRRRGIPGWGAFTQKALSGGGAMFDIGVHMLDLALWLMGEPEPVTVSGAAYCKFGHRRDVFAGWGQWDTKKFDVEDMGIGMAKFRNGASMVIEASWAAHIDEDVWKVTLVGEEGGVQTSPVKVMQEKHRMMVDLNPRDFHEISFTQTFGEEFQAFISAIRTRGRSPVPGEDGLRTAKILDGILKSSKTGREIRLG